MDFTNSVSAPALDGFAIAPHADQPLPRVTKAIFIGVGGDLRVRLAIANADLTFRNLPSGSILDVRASHVRVAGTTASDLVALV